MKKLSIIFLVLLSSASLNAKKRCRDAYKGRKNILFIMSDDFGFNDASFRGNNEIITPNIDALFYQGVILNHYYTHPLCTPSRAALLTGRYAHHIGMQNEVLWQHQPWGLGLDQKLISQYLKEAGYATHMIGKWHLGYHQKQYLPNNRGFDTHFGFDAGPFVDYWTRISTVPKSNFPGNNFTAGYDWRSNLDIDRSDEGMYVTDLLTKKTVEIIEDANDDTPFFIYLAHLAMHRANDAEPLQAKAEDYELFSHITSTKRRTYAAMVKSLDDSVGEVVAALKRTGKLDDTIIIFTTDNGGPTKIELAHPNTASNYPLRGMKGLAWEGGTRVNAVVYAPWLASGVVRDSPFHVCDWMHTLNSLANSGMKFDRNFDGMDLSKMIESNQGPFRKEVETIDQYYHTISMISGDFKIVKSTFDAIPLEADPDVWIGSNDNANHDSDTYVDRVLNSKVASSLKDYRGALSFKKIQKVRANLKIECTNDVVECNPKVAPCLFRIFEDPCERINLANNPEFNQTFNDILTKLNKSIEVSNLAPRRNRPRDFESDPSKHENVWTSWQPNVLGEQPTITSDFYKVILP